MNRKILQKVIDALNQEKPDLSYVRGILETVMESLPDPEKMDLVRTVIPIFPEKEVSQSPKGEGDILNMEARAKLKGIDLSAIQTQ